MTLTEQQAVLQILICIACNATEHVESTLVPNRPYTRRSTPLSTERRMESPLSMSLNWTRMSVIGTGRQRLADEGRSPIDTHRQFPRAVQTLNLVHSVSNAIQ